MFISIICIVVLSLQTNFLLYNSHPEENDSQSTLEFLKVDLTDECVCVVRS